MSNTPRVYIGATRQNDGKTITCLGVVSALKKRVGSIGYIKPVGQRYVEIDNHRIDEDAVLMKEVYGVRGDRSDMSPIAIPRHFTENYIDNPNPESLRSSVTQSFEKIASGNDVVVIEGTGHAGVGSVFDLSNGDVAALLASPAVIVAAGGVGRPIDEIMLNKAMFDAAGVRVIGAIINKVEDEKYDKVKHYVTRGLQRKGLDVLGVMPYRPVLTNPTFEQLLQDIDGELLSGADHLRNTVGRMVIGAMPAHQALEYMTDDSLLITPGTRDDLILAALSSCLVSDSTGFCVSGMILTGGTLPQKSILDLVKNSTLPVLLVEDDTYSVASKIAKLTVKIRPTDVAKIRAAEEMVEEFVDIDRILELARPV